MEGSDVQNNKKKQTRIPKKEIPKRRGRIIIRNLSFKTTEEKLKQHFQEFGKIIDLQLLKRSDGKLVGCAFIQFEIVQNAARAIHHKSGKEFLGRPIICDWAIAKNTYVKNINQLVEVKEEPIEIKEEPPDEVCEIKEEISEKENENKSDSEESDSEKDSDESEDEDESVDESKESTPDEPQAEKPKIFSNDVNEGKTIFIKNVPFTATNDDLKERMSQFGPMYYALVCIDPLTEHSKGSGFVKFRNAEDAEKCLSAGTELTLMGQVLDCHRAVNKNDLQNKKVIKEKKDSRNLYLVKEGVILAGSVAAQTVSPSDMTKRLELERWKTQMLRNLNMFVSKFRLVVHNLPASWGDAQLRALVTRHTPAVRECRVMRNMRDLDSSGQGRSKEYGFVTLGSHEDALKLLRALNNNPNIFTEARRPIVAFSIENKAVINSRNKRLEKSKLNNPNYNKKTVEVAGEKHVKNKNKKKNESKHVADRETFGGEVAKRGELRFRSRYKLRLQADTHHRNVQLRKKVAKTKKKSLAERRSEHIRQPKQKRNTADKRPEGDHFSLLVSRYKTKLTSDTARNVTSKWYQT